MSLIRRYRRLLQWLIAMITLAFLARVLASSWGELQQQPIMVEPFVLILSFVALMLTLFFDVVPWLNGLRGLGARLAYMDATRIWFLSNVARYVPGNIWQPVTMVVLARARGVDEVRTATSVALNWVLSNLSALIVAGLYWSIDSASPSRESLWLVPLIVMGALVVLHPAVLGRALRFVLKATRRSDVVIALSFGRLMFLLLIYCITWVGYGIAFAIFWNAFSPLDAREVPRLTGVFAAAYAIGFLSLLTPSGLGVREGALVFFLSGVYPAALVTVIALLSRVWLIVGELLCTGIVLIAGRGKDA